jgi:hypothetical protein
MKYCLVKTKQVSGFVLVGWQQARMTEVPPKKGNGKAAREPAMCKFHRGRVFWSNLEGVERR